MKPLSRRSFFVRSSVVTLAFAGLHRFAGSSALANATDGFDKKLEADFYGTIDLPSGFRYTLCSEVGEKMDDGLLVPGKHDGMGAFSGPGGRTILIRNHELGNDTTEAGPFGSKRTLLRQVPREKMFDSGKGKKPANGGTTTLVFNTKEQKLERHFLSLAGTIRNCAGGVTPWGTWVTCEEDTSRPNEGGQTPDDPMEQHHGWNFEVAPTDRPALAEPVPLKAMGRFRHEAVAVDPRSGAVYQTEDRGDGLFFRFLPDQPGKLAKGGRLQALKLRDKARADTRNWHAPNIAIGQKLTVEWVDIANVEAPDDDLRYQGFFERGAARFARGEGCWYGRDSVFFACTNGGAKHKGQIFRYTPSPDEATSREANKPGTLELYIEPNDGKLIENADNLTIAPWGDLIVCEDGTNPQFLVGITPDGKYYKLARTNLGELAGAVFSPDGSTLFVNIQTTGVTVAITGPWETLRAQAV